MTKEEILLQILGLRKAYNGLLFKGEEMNSYKISGEFEFRATYSGETIEDSYQILITVPKSFPQKIPTIKETGGDISPSFHTNPDDTLCLEAPVKLYMTFNENPTLLHFIDSCAIPYFYSHSYLQKYGELPFEDRAHGGEGLLNMYKELFNIESNHVTIALIKILAENKYKGSNFCPCNSGKKLYECHGPLIKEIINLQGSKHFAVEYIQILNHFRESNIKIDKNLISTTAFKKAKKLLSK